MSLGHQIRQYFAYRRHAKTRYGLHSPFVYRLHTQAIHGSTPREAYRAWKAYRRALLRDRQYLEVEPLGAGSHRLGGTRRRIDRMARVAGTSPRKARLWMRLAGYFAPSRILELGTHLGLGTYALSLGAPGARITSVEGDPALARYARHRLQEAGAKQVSVENSLFASFLAHSAPQAPYDLVLVDGDHRYAPTLAYFEQLMPLIHNDTLVIWDDIHWSEEMTEAWNTIIARPEVHVSIDLFCCGLTFLRRQQYKEHFILKF